MDSNNRQMVQKGEILIAQGETPAFLPLLHKGAIEILSASGEYDGLDGQLIASKSKRVGVIKGEALIAGFNELLSGPYKKTIRACENSQISKFPLNNGGIKLVVSNNPKMAMNILNHLIKRLESSLSDESKYLKLFQNLCMVDDNFSIMHKSITESPAFENLQSKADGLFKTYKSNGGKPPQVFDTKFLIGNNSQFLKKKYAFPGLPIEAVIDYKQCQFTKKLLKVNPKIFGAIIREDSSIITDIYDIITVNLLKILDRIEVIHNEIDNELSRIFGPDTSWTVYLVDNNGFDEYLNAKRLKPDFIKNFLSLIKKIHGMYQEISGKSLIESYEGCKKIHNFYMSKTKNKGPASIDDSSNGQDSSQSAAKGNLPGVYRNSMKQIFEFGLIDKETQQTIVTSLNEFKNMSNPFNTETEGRKIRKRITKIYWDIYKQIFIRSLKESLLPQPVKLMLDFGFFDENLLEPEQIQELHGISSVTSNTRKIPILREVDFLKGIYDGNENPSITEMGLTYEAFLREEDKHKSRKSRDKAGLDSLDENTKKTMYEIDHRLAQTVAVCSGSSATAFPILTSLIIKGSFNNFFQSPDKLMTAIKSLMDVDYSAFYRETVVKLGEAREVTEEEVIPNFILLPSYGSKTMLWQELDGKNRKTRGRIVIPIFFIGDIVKSLAHSFASFRWELNRTIKGGMWADPVDGGLTGVYFDYVNFYKKNRKLSAETKAKITERFKSLRTNRDRFADDYTMWLLYEKDGILRVNSVIREMFYRHVPFKSELRERLENMPAYSDIANRYKNIQNKNIAGYERKYKKYIDETGNYPADLQRYMNFLKR